MDEPIPLLYYDDEDSDVEPTSLFPEATSTPSVAPIASPTNRGVLPSKIDFDDATTESSSEVNSLAPILDWDNKTGEGELYYKQLVVYYKKRIAWK